MSYLVTLQCSSGIIAQEATNVFREAVDAAKRLSDRRQRNQLVTVENHDRSDLCTSTGWNDGLTDEEREQLDGIV